MIFPIADGKSIELVQGDITREATDAIVNAANEALMPGGGVCGAIHRAGGPAIVRECRAIADRIGHLPAGRAVATTGGDLPARYVIHTPGPVYEDGRHGEPETLASCYRESLRVADELGLSSVAFPALSTGIFGYPVELAAPIALEAVRDALAACGSVRRVRFVLFSEDALEAHALAARAIFPR